LDTASHGQDPNRHHLQNQLVEGHDGQLLMKLNSLVKDFANELGVEAQLGIVWVQTISNANRQLGLPAGFCLATRKATGYRQLLKG
jgi:hypothetical protein